MIEGAGETGWVVPPPPPGGVSLYLDIDENAELTPELRAAIEALTRALPAEESVQGYARTPAPDLGARCRRDSGSCSEVYVSPCYSLIMCYIGPKVQGPRP